MNYFYLYCSRKCGINREGHTKKTFRTNNLKYTFPLSSSAEFSTVGRGEREIAAWKVLVSPLYLCYQRYVLGIKILLCDFFQMVSHRGEDGPICDRLNGEEMISSGNQSRKTGGYRPLYPPWETLLNICICVYMYMCIYMHIHIHVSTFHFDN